ncbi:MAG: ATP:cob(I)alamin adenosyltransferase, partial [Chloroflexi bacterium RBG_16_57_9]
MYGTLDEATSALGMARATTRYDDICQDVLELQGELISVMAELATPPKRLPSVLPMVSAQVERLEQKIDGYEQERITTGQFVRPGGSLASATLDLARTVIRRAERLLVALSQEESTNPILLQYLNRLSDLLYVMARIDEQREIRRLVMSTLQSAAGQAQKVGSTKTVLSLATCD